MVVYGLAIICGVFLFCRYKNNFYLWKYLVNYCKFFKKIKISNKRNKNKKRINKKILIVMGILIVLFIIICIILYISQLKNIIEKNMNIIVSTLFSLIVVIASVDVIVLCWPSEYLKKLIGKFEILRKNFIEIIVFILLFLSEINTLNWFQKFNYVLSNLFSKFLFLICIIYILKITILNISKSKKWILNIGFLIIFFGMTFRSDSNKDFETGIRITKGELKELEGGSIELFSKNGRNKFDIVGKNKELYIKNDSLFKYYNITKTLFNKENNLSLVIEKIPNNKVVEVKQGELIFVSNKNSKILDRCGNEINDKISIEGKIVVVVENSPNNYIFIGNNSGWAYLNKNERIGIEKDNFYYNLLNLILFLFGIMYFGLKLYGKKSRKYYNEEIINKIREEEIDILLDRNKYDKFLTLSMFGLTIPNIWKIVTTKSIGEMNSSIWTKIDIIYIIYIILFSILLFCLITSKEISEYVEELEKENEKEGYIEYYI